MSRIKGIIESGANFESRFIPDFPELKDVVETLKKSGYRIVLTQGVYDLIHLGHANYLERGKEKGDILVVGVDSDDLTRKRKGPRRPIVPQDERLRMLTFLRSVSIVTLREASHGLDDLIELVKPDVLIMSETTQDFPVEKKEYLQRFCGEIVILPAQAETNSSARIRHLMIDGAQELGELLGKTVQEYISGNRK